jgi:hypothetical protein
MAITHNLGRINNCKIVGTKNRFIEVRCAEEPCTQNCWECIDGDCVAQIGGQFDNEAACLANPLVNSCLADKGIDSGIFTNSSIIFLDWYFTNHPTQPISNYFFEMDGPCSLPPPYNLCGTAIDTGVYATAIEYFDWMGNNAPNGDFEDYYYECSNCACPAGCCYGPNGDQLNRLNLIRIKDSSSNILQTVTTVGALVTWMNANGVPAATVTDGWWSLDGQWSAYQGGSLQTMGVPCSCIPIEKECCYGPNGGYLASYTQLTISDVTSGATQLGPVFNTYTALIAWANTQGCTVNVGMTYSAVTAAISTCLCDSTGSGGGSSLGDCTFRTDINHVGIGGENAAWNYMLANGLQSVDALNAYYWDAGYPPLNAPECANAAFGGNSMHTWVHINIIHDYVSVSPMFTSPSSLDDWVIWANANIGPGFNNTMTKTQFSANVQVYLIPDPSLPGSATGVDVWHSTCMCNGNPQPCTILIDHIEEACECSGCGSGPLPSWECYEGASGSYCADPGDGSGQYPDEASCLTALSSGSNSTCNINGPSASARTNAVPGTVFTDYLGALLHYTDPGNGLSGTDAMTLYFEIEAASAMSFCNNLPSNQTCCEGANSTIAIPTINIYLRYMSFFMPYEDPAYGTTYCCPNPALQLASGANDLGIQYIPFLQTNADYASFYGNDGFDNNMSWTWDDILTDAMAANITGITMSTAYNYDASIPGNFLNYVSSWMLTNPPEMIWCGGNNSCVLNGSVYTALSFPGGTGMYDWYAANSAADIFSAHHFFNPAPAGITQCVADGTAFGLPDGSFTYILKVFIRDAAGIVGTGEFGGTNALAAALNAYPGALISTATGSMTQVQISNLIFSSSGVLKGGGITPAFTGCGCPPLTWFSEVCSINYTGPYAIPCNQGISSCTDYGLCICEDACSNITYDCNPKTCDCYDPGTGLGAYTGPTALADCQLACCPIRNKDSWNCKKDGTCQDPGDGTGVYTSLALCQSSGGADSCATKTDVGFQTSTGFVYDWFVSSALYSTNFSDYKYETLMAGNGSTACLGPNNKWIYYMVHTSLHSKGTVLGNASNVNDLIALIISFGGTSAVNTMTMSQLGTVIYTEIDPTANFTFSAAPCYCSACGGTDLYDCLPGAGCQVVSGGQYASLGDCQAASVWVNSCDGLVRVSSPGSSINLIAGDMDQLLQFITLQSNLYTSVDVQTLYTYLDAGWEQNNCLPASTDPCTLVTESGNPQITFGPYVLYDGNTGATLPGFAASYVKWDLFLAAAVAIPATNITATTQFADARSLLVTWGNSLGKKAVIRMDYTCCTCTDGCPPREPDSDSCLILWLDAEQGSIDVQQPPVISGPQIVERWYNKAYNGINLPIDLTAFYTWDVISNLPLTAPTFDITTWSFPTVRFSSKTNVQYLIANPLGPAAPKLQPDTSDSTHNHGWSVFFHRSASADEWINSKSWFMGDDWSVSDDENQQQASGLKPHGQPYCKSNYYGHNHADEIIADSYYESSPLNETLGTGHRTLKNNMWYLHWIIAEEQIPYGSGYFDVTWGIGNTPQFKDTIKGINLDMVLANINTRNRGKDGFVPGQGFFSEIRAYNCAFNNSQLSEELLSFETKYNYGTLNIPSALPLPCGEAFVSTALNGVDGTYISIQDNDNIAPSVSGFTAAFWIKFNSCPEGELSKDACLFEKGMNGPVDNEKVSFRLFMSDDPGNEGNLYWDVFGSRPESYAGNYSRQRSSIAWLGDGTCNNMVGKWHHITVTTSGPAGRDKKIYIDGKDYTGVGSDQITGNIIRNGYPLNLGDSSRVNYTTSGNYGPFITWNTELSSDVITKLYANGESYFNPLVNDGLYQEKDSVSFYSQMDSSPTLDRSIMYSQSTWYGGVSLDNRDIDAVDAGLPTDIPGLEIWLRAGTKMLADQDSANKTISRADYMVGNNLQVGDKLAIWECHANTGKYCAQTTQSFKPKYQSDGTSVSFPKAVYTDSTDRLQIFNTRADGGINLDATNGTDQGAFTIMWRVNLEGNLISESFMGDTSNNSIRMNSTTQIRVKLGGSTNKNFNLPAGSVFSNMTEYIFTLDRDVNGVLNCHVDGGAFSDFKLSGSGTLTETSAATIDHIIGIPGIGMQGWFFDLMCWKDIVISVAIRKAMYRVMRETVRKLI